MKLTGILLVLFLGATSSTPETKQNSGLGLIRKETSPHHGPTSVYSLEAKVGVYKGNSTTMNTHRYLVGVLKSGTYWCSGAIVSENWVLTTGDCARKLTVPEATVVSGSSDGVAGVTHPVLQIVRHPGYGQGVLDYEYACLQVQGKFYYWAKRSHFLPKGEPEDFKNIVVAGYGYTDSSSTKRELRQANMIWLPKSRCRRVYAHHDFTWTDRMGCAYSPDKATLCNGDFGDSFVVGRVLFGQFIGVSKAGFCTNASLPVILSDVHAEAEWIQGVTGALYDQTQPGEVLSTNQTAES